MRKTILNKFEAFLNTVRGGSRRSERDMVQHVSLQVHLAHDDEADVWYIAKSDIPGLVLEAESVEALFARIQEAAPQMIELNCQEILDGILPCEPAAKSMRAPSAPRPALSWKPVFDSDFALA